ncbi:MAG: FecR domain-containing protein [Steroidobacteraceae bacterium]
MNSETRASRRELAAREAAEWLLELRQGALGAAHREELVDWLRESPLNVAEFLRVARVSHTLDGFQGWDRLPDSAPGVADNIIELTRDPAAARGPHSERNLDSPRPVVRPRRRRFAWVAAAAGGAAAAVAAVWLFHFTTGATLRTAAGERREVTLADGSIVSLAPASEVRVRFASTERDLWLLRGEAFFRVHKNLQRPFIVEVNGNRVRAVGTAFGVRQEQADAVVTVVEGVVSVSAGQAPSLPAGQAPAAAPLLLGANQQLRIPNDGTRPSVKVINGSIEVAWTAGELIFDDEALSDVVRRFNAHNRLQIVIMDSALAARRVSGVFRASDPESFVTFIQAAGGVPAPPTARRDGDRIYVGEAAPASK